MVTHDKRIVMPASDFGACPIAAAAAALHDSSLPFRDFVTGMILSVSGWRTVFAADGNEESGTAEVSPSGVIASAAAVLAFADHLLASGNGSAVPELVLGRDTRPTGCLLADIALRILLAKGIAVRYLSVSAAPELMAYSAMNGTSDGFVYITASHNPVGHNGFKFGRGGGVVDRKEAAAVISRFRELCQDSALPQMLSSLAAAAPESGYRQTIDQIPAFKYEALDAYRTFTIMTAASTRGICGQDQVMSRIRSFAEEQGLGIVADLNGSARTCSIDLDLLGELGIRVRPLNDQPGSIAHAIIPEGSSLDDCAEALEQAYREDPAFLFGYVPDNDGDRGNIVYLDENTGRAVPLEAQEVFALAVLSELAFSWVSNPDEAVRRAVAVNGPTSLRIEAIAGYFAAEVQRCEVGEANTVNLARELRDKGWEVRILGEGSNGGNITHPARVRDPMNTLLSFIKLMALRDNRESSGLYRTWLEKSGQADRWTEHFSLSDILQTLPRFCTTTTSSPEAVLRISACSPAALKAMYEKLFAEQWNKDRDTFFADLGICAWKEFNTEGTLSKEGIGTTARSGEETGGLKVQFYDEKDEAVGFIWMRGSGTEPVFRILADSRGSDCSIERKLLAWHTDLVIRADKLLVVS